MERMLQLDPRKRISAKDMLYHPFFVNIHKMIPPHIYAYAQNLLTPIKPKPSTSITEGKRHTSSSIDRIEGPQLAANADISNKQRLAKTAILQKNTTANSAIKLHTIDTKQNQKVNMGESLRGNSLSMNMSINPLSVKQSQKQGYFSPQKPVIQTLDPNSSNVIATRQNNLELRQSRRVAFKSPQQNIINPTSTINIFIPLRR
jgi:serine/threonine protein kinase